MVESSLEKRNLESQNLESNNLESRQISINTLQQGIVDIKSLCRILQRRSALVVGVSSVVIAIGAVLAYQARTTYQSSMQIMVSSNLYQGVRSPRPEGGTDSDFTDPNFQVVDYTAQEQLMLSTRLVRRAVDLLDEKYPKIDVEDIKGKKGKTSPLKVSRIEGGSGVNKVLSQVFEISYKGKSSQKVQDVLEALQQVYQNYNIEQQQERLTKGLSFVNERLPQIKKEVIKSEKNLEKFRRQYKLLDPKAQSEMLLESLAKNQLQLQTTLAQLKDVQARYVNMKQKLASSPRSALVSSRLSESTRYQTLLNEIQKTELELAQERLRYTEDSPQVKELTERRKNQMSLLEQEVGRTLGDKQIQSLGNSKILTKGQMAGVDLKLVEELVELQTQYLGLSANEKSLRESAEETRQELSRYPTLIAEYNRLLPEVETNRKTLEQLMQAQQSLGLKIAQGGFDWQILEEPQEGVSLGSGRLLRLIAAILIGPMLGVIAALIREQFNDNIYSGEEITKLTNIRLLGTLPKISLVTPPKGFFGLPFPKKDQSKAQALTLMPFHETLDMAFQNIQILKSSLPYKSLAITSSVTGEGTSTVTMGLAHSAARMHKRVLIIDANLRESSLHQVLKLSNDWGLSLLLLDETNDNLKNYIQPIHPSIDILTAGPQPEDPVKILSSGRMKELIQRFEEIYDLVLIDAPPIICTVDSRIVASFCDGVIMVARPGKVSRTQIIQSTDVLSSLNLIGIISNEVK
ncbi:MAG: polysaccharide biosynthesis tyrosine autokinase [Cyanobacteria bacterium P01_A01_bin.45]